ncbi:serine hydrolase domain-containing protein [Actinomadura harenae]|uniref:Class A beta-lactamase-related serine hydrolase n=1 Tax=Actinomadura harenae TaxID=2483351 RepID=A0A3M2MH58_9ACTN|nr:serine hydrolase domain-containing protein [Actinomadura harenae]RMI46588.1 class A beta-lactamase-related serine hydrolase [Actinomadura harenae]
MRKPAFLAFAAVALTSVATAVPASAAAPSTLQRDADALRDLGVTGVQVRVTGPDGRSRVVTSGVADVRTKRPVPSNGRFRVASVTKTLTATTVLQLVGEGRLSVDDTVEHVLPGVVQGNGNDGRKITIRNLLQHTSGLHDDMPSIDSPESYALHRLDTHTAEELVARSMNHKPDFEPGKGWHYCNTGYLLLGMVIKKLTGNPWDTEVRNRILRPLGMDHTTFPGESPRITGPHARGYQLFETGGLTDVTENRDSAWAGAAGGLISTTADLDRFFRALDAGRLLRPAQQRELRRGVPVQGPQAVVWPGATDGLGLFSRPLTCGGSYSFHPGDILGYKTRNAVTSDGRRSVVISMSTMLEDSLDHTVQQEDAVSALIENVLCTTR